MRSGRRGRIAILSTSLRRGGSERYALELARVFLARGWPVDVLTHRVGGGEQHFAPILRAEGARVLPVISWPGHLGRPPGWRLPALSQAAKEARALEETTEDVEAWARFLQRYRAVLVLQIENYYNLQGALDRHPRASVHLVSHEYQYDESPYRSMPSGSQIRIIAQDEVQLAEFVAGTGGVAHMETIPLGFDFEPFAVLDRTARPRSASDPLRVGVFIRISRQRPIGPLFEALARINEKASCELYHYGGHGDPSEFSAQLRALGIEDRVVFRGPSDDLRASLMDDRIDYAWMTSIGPSVGYASLELSALGMPIVFWSEAAQTAREVRESSGGAVHAFNRVRELADFHLQLAAEPRRLREAGVRLRKFLVERHDLGRSFECRLRAYDL